YSRFWHRFLHDIGLVSAPEPYAKRTSHGMILGENNEKMSKSRGNVILPDDVIAEYGADTFRMYEMFLGAYDQPIPWSTAGIKGCRRFIERIWKAASMVVGDEGRQREGMVHKAIKKISLDMERMKFNTAISAAMTAFNEIYESGYVTRSEFGTMLRLMNPIAPHVTEELWERLGYGGRLYAQAWPEWDESKVRSDEVEVAVQVNGRLKCTVTVPAGSGEDEVREAAMGARAVMAALDGRTVVREVYVEGKIMNFVVSGG
ncbi:MAG: class I tRNA ligase family protein, partial [Oscillospiraceae bacterium]|nr:class I tRNA ligase family protein [Oscillospiraceae bacterium]